MRPAAARRTVILLAAAALAACGAPSPEAVETETVVPVATTAVRVGSIRPVVHATGTVTPGPGASLTVTAPETARIAALPKAEGDAVSRGDLLVRFDIPSLGADAATRRAEVDRAEARLRNARAAQTRAHDLYSRGVAARKEVEDADRELSDAEAALAEARAGREASTTLSARTTVQATFDGVVANRFHDPGDIVEPGAGDPVLRVIDPRRLEVDAAIPIPDVPEVAVGAPARVIVGAGRPPEPATVISRPAAVDQASGTVPVRLRFDTPTRLAAGTPVEVEIDGAAHAQAVLIPTAALVREGADTAVFVVADGKAHRVPVQTGIVTADTVEILSGVSAGAQVITQGQAGLPDGAAVSASREKP